MTRRAREAWLKTLGALLAVLLAGTVIGALFAHPALGLALAALCVLGWHYWRLRRVLSNMIARRHVAPPDGPGLWNELDRMLSRSQAETRVRKRRLVEMLRAYSAAANVLPDAIVVVDSRTRRIEWFNEAANPLLGLQYPRDLGNSVQPLLQGLSKKDWLEDGPHAETLLDEASPIDPSVRMTLRVVPYSEDFWLLVARDTSKLMRLEQSRRDFVANVSHELRTPLTVLHGYLDMLDPEEQPELAPILHEMRLQTVRMNQLVEDLLALSRLDAAERSPDERVPMTTMLATLDQDARALSQGRHNIAIVDEAGVDLWGSQKELRSAFSNLVSNAVRYTPANGRIEVRFEPLDSGGVALRVRDTGFGIPAQHLARLTERFYRVSNSRSRETGGTGLGLAIAKHALGLHGGTLTIASDVGEGSTFSCEFPAERVRARIATPSETMTA